MVSRSSSICPISQIVEKQTPINQTTVFPNLSSKEWWPLEGLEQVDGLCPPLLLRAGVQMDDGQLQIRHCIAQYTLKIGIHPIEQYTVRYTKLQGFQGCLNFSPINVFCAKIFLLFSIICKTLSIIQLLLLYVYISLHYWFVILWPRTPTTYLSRYVLIIGRFTQNV